MNTQMIKVVNEELDEVDTLLVYETEHGYWYVYQGYELVNLTHELPEGDCLTADQINAIEDVECFTASFGIMSLLSLKEEVDEYLYD